MLDLLSETLPSLLFIGAVLLATAPIVYLQYRVERLDRERREWRDLAIEAGRAPRDR